MATIMDTNDTSFTARLIEFQKTIPLVIGAVSIGVCTVNRTTIKWMIHLAIATLIGFIFQYISKLFTTAFLFSSFAYVLTCANTTGSVDDFLQIVMTIGFSVLWFIDMYVLHVTQAIQTDFSTTYLLTALTSGLIGILGVYIVKTMYPDNRGLDYLYDFKGCSCDDCANANQCPNDSSGSNGANGARKVLMRRIE
jgi:hypothetical protein